MFKKKPTPTVQQTLLEDLRNAEREYIYHTTKANDHTHRANYYKEEALRRAKLLKAATIFDDGDA